MKGSEWTLVFFTLFIQTAVGLLLTFGLVNGFTGWRNSITNGKEINDKILFIVCILFIAALVISFLHLGNVKNAFYALSNLSDSWMSREILFVAIFGMLVCVFTLISSKNIFSPAVQNIVGAAAVLCGLVLVFVMAKIYMLEIVPAWNNAFTPISFYFSALILGGFTFITGTLFFLHSKGVSISESSTYLPTAKIIIGILAMLVFAELVIWFFQIILLSNGERASVESFNLIIKENLLLFAARIVFQLLGLALLSYCFLMFNRGNVNEKFIYISYLAILIAEIIGRYLFYAMYARVGV